MYSLKNNKYTYLGGKGLVDGRFSLFWFMSVDRVPNDRLSLEFIW